MKELLIFIFFLLGTPVFAQLNTFKEGDVISAEQMNENFEALLEKTGPVRSKTVDCDAGETINAALSEGYNDITVYGTCTEEIVAMSPVDGTQLGRTERFPSEPLSHIIITGGEPNRGAILSLGSQVSSAFQASIQLTNLTIKDRISVFANSFLYLKNVTHAVEPGNESKIRVAENSVIKIEESDLSEPVELHNGSTAMIHQVNLNVANDGQFFDVVRGSNLEVFDSTITHQSSQFSVSSLGQLSSVETLFRAVENSSIHVSGSTINTTTSAAFVLDQGSSLILANSIVSSDSRFSVVIVRSHLHLDNSTLENNGLPLIILDGSYGRFHSSTVRSTGGYNAVSLAGSYLSIQDQSKLESNTSTSTETDESDYSTISMTKFSNLEIANSSVTNLVDDNDPETDNHEAIWMRESCNLKIANSTITSSTSSQIDARDGSNVFLQENNDFITNSNNSNKNIQLRGRSSLYFGSEDYSALTVDCTGRSYVQSYIQEISETVANSGCLTDSY